MDRLTEYDYLAGTKVGDLKVGIDERRAFHRLAAYEDTGLMPEAVEQLKLASMGKAIAEIKEFDGVPLDRLRELVQADKDGRVIIAPCKEGDYVEWNNGICKSLKQVKGIMISSHDLGMRIMLDDCSPVVNHSAIGGYVDREAAEATLKDMGKGIG